MAHTLCINEHSMWNGDEKVCVDTYPVELIKKISEENPDRKFGDNDSQLIGHQLLPSIYENENPKYRCFVI
jgi:hypothetical protein